MKHEEAGLRAGLTIHPNGETFINAEILNENTGKSKIISFLIDTGFNGYLQLSESDVKELELVIKDKSRSTLAHGVTIETGITTTKIKIFEQEMSNFPIQLIPNGLSLIGTQLLRDAGAMLVFDYQSQNRQPPTITKDSRLKAEIKSLIDKFGSN